MKQQRGERKKGAFYITKDVIDWLQPLSPLASFIFFKFKAYKFAWWCHAKKSDINSPIKTIF
jgi:hypothetical protein